MRKHIKHNEIKQNEFAKTKIYFGDKKKIKMSFKTKIEYVTRRRNSSPGRPRSIEVEDLERRNVSRKKNCHKGNVKK